jgi:hypothetical protein
LVAGRPSPENEVPAEFLVFNLDLVRVVIRFWAPRRSMNGKVTMIPVGLRLSKRGCCQQKSALAMSTPLSRNKWIRDLHVAVDDHSVLHVLRPEYIGVSFERCRDY